MTTDHEHHEQSNGAEHTNGASPPTSTPAPLLRERLIEHARARNLVAVTTHSLGHEGVVVGRVVSVNHGWIGVLLFGSVDVFRVRFHELVEVEFIAARRRNRRRSGKRHEHDDDREGT